MKRVREFVDWFLRGFLVFLMGAMVVNVLWQVFARFILQNPSSYTEEMARFMLVWVGVLGAAYAGGQKMHLAIDLLVQHLKGRGKLILELLIDCAVALFSLFVLGLGGARLVYLTWSLEQTSAALQIPLAFVYAVVPISGLLFVFYSCLSGLESLEKLIGAEA